MSHADWTGQVLTEDELITLGLFFQPHNMVHMYHAVVCQTLSYDCYIQLHRAIQLLLKPPWHSYRRPGQAAPAFWFCMGSCKHGYSLLHSTCQHHIAMVLSKLHQLVHCLRTLFSPAQADQPCLSPHAAAGR